MVEISIRKADVLVEAIPYIHDFRRKVFVIKYGGSILDDANIRKNVLEDIVFLSFVGIRTILVHGGGPHISARLLERGSKAKFVNGIRVTDKETLNIVEEELDKLNQTLVKEIKKLKGEVTGIQGQNGIIHVEKKKSSEDLGFVGTITNVDTEKLESYMNDGNILTISPMGADTDNQVHNVNADEAASAIAKALKAEKFMLLTNVKGVMQDPQKVDTLISTLTPTDIKKLIDKKVIQGGMIPKVNACVEALHGGVHKTHIVDARMRHALLLEIFTDSGIGTQIIRNK